MNKTYNESRHKPHISTGRGELCLEVSCPSVGLKYKYIGLRVVKEIREYLGEARYTEVGRCPSLLFAFLVIPK